MNIRDMSRKYSIPMDTLRYYEKMELIGKTERNGNRRIYTDKECKELEFIMIAREAGLPIEILKKFMIANRDENIDITEKKNLLLEEVEYIKANMKKEEFFINKVNNRIDKYTKEIEEREEREKRKAEKELERIAKAEAEKQEKEKAKEDKRLEREKKKEEEKLRKQQEKLERKIARKKAREEAKRQQQKEAKANAEQEEEEEE